jgi:DEAD/DEAH box helicase domain-containing protein
MSVTVRSRASVYTINDNNRSLFQMFKLDGSYVVPAPELYSDPPHLPRSFEGAPEKEGAIGAVNPTDVLILNLDNLDLPGPEGRIPSDTRVMPGGTSALWSFAEAFRVAAALELDVASRELDIGLQPYPSEHGLARRIFIADSLENGAGYATHLGKPDVLDATLRRVFEQLQPKWEAERHARECGASCPDCLRNYDNRRLHPYLDWRLALDVAELAVGRSLTTSRWLDRAAQLTSTLAKAFGLTEVSVGPLCGAMDEASTRVAFFSHPLWRLDAAYFTTEQAQAHAAALKLGASEARAFDLLTLARAPQNVFAWLVA